MRRSITKFLLILCAGVSLAGTPGAADPRPNILLILADDFGRELLSDYGGRSGYRTPALDRMIAEGMRFETCYATPMCAPSRVELLTGRYSFRNYTDWETLDRGQVTFAQLLRDAGYDTAMAGKWHPMGGWDLDPAPPVHAGFDRYCSYDSRKLGEQAKAGKGNRFWGGTILRDGREEILDRYGPEVFSDFLVDFMRAERDGPFLAFYCMTAMHRPFQPTPDHPDAPAPGQAAPEAWLGHRGEPANFEPMLRYADRMVGKLLDAAAAFDNTLVVFTADNGTDNVNEARTIRSTFMNREVRGGKYFPTELGVNVPFIVRWPGVIGAGRTSGDGAVIDFTDLFPTLCDLAGVSLPKEHALDGRSLVPLLRGAGDEPAPKSLTFTWGNYENNSSKYKDPANSTDKLLGAIRDERYKYYSDGRLFDLREDFLEEHPLDPAGSEAVRRSLRSALEKLRRSEPRRW